MNGMHTTEANATHKQLSNDEVSAVFAKVQLALNERDWAATLRAQELLYGVRGRLTYKTQFAQCARLFGECAFLKGDYAAAVVWLRQGDPNGLLLADALYAMGKFKDAAILYRNAAQTAKPL